MEIAEEWSLMANGDKGLLERHLQTFLLGLVSVAVIWFGRATLDTQDQVIVQSGEISALKDKMVQWAESHKELQALEHRHFANTIEEHEVRLQELEGRMK